MSIIQRVTNEWTRQGFWTQPYSLYVYQWATTLEWLIAQWQLSQRNGEGSSSWFCSLSAFQDSSFLYAIVPPCVPSFQILKLWFSNLRKKKQDEEEAEQKRKATDTAYQGRFSPHTVKYVICLQEIWISWFMWVFIVNFIVCDMCLHIQFFTFIISVFLPRKAYKIKLLTVEWFHDIKDKETLMQTFRHIAHKFNN